MTGAEPDQLSEIGKLVELGAYAGTWMWTGFTMQMPVQLWNLITEAWNEKQKRAREADKGLEPGQGSSIEFKNDPED